MDIYEAMQTQRAVRRLRADPIPNDVLERVLKAATWAPTGGNVQPWRLVVVADPKQKQALQKLYQPRWNDYIKNYRKRLDTLSPSDRTKSERTIEAGDHLAANLGNVPVIAVFCYNPSMMAITDSAQPRPSVVGGGSVYPSVQNLLLACRNEGLGCVLTTLLCMDEPAVKALLALPPDWYTCAHVPIGYPIGGGYGTITRRPLAKMVYRDAWEKPFV
jgi:nitroreductase